MPSDLCVFSVFVEYFGKALGMLRRKKKSMGHANICANPLPYRVY